MSRHYPCYWSNSRDCTKGFFEDMKDVFIIGSCDQNREEYIEEIKNIIEEVGLNPIFAEDLKENTNLDAFCDNICSHIRGSRIIINDISAPLKYICKKCETSDFVPSLNVYWEYGYAAGMGKPQIVICDQEQFDKIPFDVAGKQILKYTRATLKDILKPQIEIELTKPIPKSRFHVIYSDTEKKEIDLQDVEYVKNELIGKISDEDLKIIFTFYPKYNEEDLFPLDNEMINFLESNLPTDMRGYSVFRGQYNFTLNPTYLTLLSNLNWFGNNILIHKDGIIIYGTYVNGDQIPIPIPGNVKFFPFHELLDRFLAVLNYIQQIFEKVGYNENIHLSMYVENINTYRYTVGEFERSLAVRDDNIGKFNSSGIETIKREIDLLELENPEYKIEISKYFFNTILRGFGKADSEKYDEFLKLMQERT